MKKLNFILLIAGLLIVSMAAIAMASLQFPGPKITPSAGTFLTSTSVMYNFTLNQTSNNVNEIVNVSIYNATTKTGPYNIIAVNTSIIANGSVAYGTFTRTFTQADGKRYYWFVNVTNGTNPLVSGIYTFNVDSNYNRIVIGSATLNLNFTMYHGATRFSCGINNSAGQFGCGTY